MPQNKLIYWGILVLATAIALYAGAVLTAAIKQYTPYVGGVGILMILCGFFFESRKQRAAAEQSAIEGSSAATPTSQSAEPQKAESPPTEG